MLDRLVAAGMDVARLNFSHGTHDEHAEVIRAIRDGEATWGHPVTIVQDLQGPKVRLGPLRGRRRRSLLNGETFTLIAKSIMGTDSARDAVASRVPARAQARATRSGWTTA